MSLQTRLLLGYGVLFALLVASALGAATGFRDLGDDIGQVLEDNFASIRASVRMIESLERQDSAVLALLVDSRSPESPLARAEASFREALQAARDNVTLAEEEPVLARIDTSYARYRTAYQNLLADPGQRPLAAYESTTQPRFEEVKDAVLALLEINHGAMVAADERARRSARARAAIHGLLVALAALALVPMARAISKSVLDRLKHLREVAQAIAAGDRRRRVVVDRDDELGLVGRQLNAMLDRQLQLESDIEGRLARERQFVLGLLGALPGPAALLARSGKLLASTLTEDDRERLEAEIQPGDDRLWEDATVRRIETDGAAFELRLLDDGSRRPVGWLVVPAPPES